MSMVTAFSEASTLPLLFQDTARDGGSDTNTTGDSLWSMSNGRWPAYLFV